MELKLEYGSIGFFLAILFSILVGASGCYATCTPPEMRAKSHGVVLDCNVERPDGRYTDCNVSTESGDRNFRYVSCQ